MAAFRFALQASGAASPAAWRDLARKAEDLGYSTLYVPDHLDDQWAPMVALTVAAEATTTLRVGTLVLDNDFRHPLVLAKEAATLDVVTGGRFEFGMGAGWLTTDYEQSGIPMELPSVRVARLAESLEIMRTLWRTGSATFSGEHYRVEDAVASPAPVTPGGPPLVIGGGSRRILTLAGQYAEIVSIVPSLAAGYIGPEVAAESVVEKYADRVRWAREAAGERADDLELQCWTAAVQVVPNAGRGVRVVGPRVRPDARAVARRPRRPHRLGERDRRHPADAEAGARLQQHRRARGGDGRAGAGDHANLPAPEPPTRIGILGGTFDPPHVGHVAAARAVIEQVGLDRLLLVVANDPWQKSGQRAISPAEDRYALTEALAEEIPGAEASRLEIDRGGPSYSVDTAEEVLALTGAAGRPTELFLVVGADLVPELGDMAPGRGSAAAGHPGRRVPSDGRRPGAGAGLAGGAGGRPAGRGLELGGP